MSVWRIRIRTFLKYKDLLIELVSRNLKLKYRRSFLGYIWSILNPLLIMIVMTIVFSTMFKRSIENFPVYLLTGRLLFDLVMTSTNKAMHSITGNAPLLKKTYVPKYIFTLAAITSCLVDFVLSLGALLLVMLVTGVKPTLYLIFVPLVALQTYIFCCGFGFFLAQANVFFRDIQYIYNAFTTAWLYMTPIFYPIDALPNKLQFIIKALNPMYYYIAQFRDLVCYARFPGPRIFWGGWLIAFLFLFVGIYSFQRNKNKFILYI